MKIRKEFGSCSETEENGKWFPLEPGVRIKLRSFQSQRSQNVRTELERPYAGILNTGRNIPAKAQDDIVTKQIAQGVIVDWEGFEDEDEDGNDIPLEFSVAAAESLMKDAPKFKDLIAHMVMGDDAFKDEVKAAEAKN